MIDHTIDIQQLSFIKVVQYVCHYLKWANYLFFVLFLLTVFVGLFINSKIWLFFPVYLVGVVLSLSIHEYMHLLVIKKISNNRYVRIQVNWFTFEIVPLKPIKGLLSIVVACSGPLLCTLISITLLLLRSYIMPTSISLLLLAVCYGFHIISFFPISGDGAMIVKGITDLMKGGEIK